MSTKLRAGLMLLLAVVLLVGASRVQLGLNVDREKLGLTRVQPLENAPPVLAFTTVALGGFRGLISNLLWIRANDLQEDDKFFEMAQLADWITKLEPHYVQVWLVQAWNMAYNISVKFKDFPDRWRWVSRAIALLRDDGLRWNPNEILIYRELGWIFQHKVGQNLDDANIYYKQQWANEMATVFDKKTPNLDELIHPTTPDQLARLNLLTNKFKMNPVAMKQADELYGPLEWRLPEAHAIYWGMQGLKAAEAHPTKIKPDDLITLRRLIYQSMQLSFQRGRLITNLFAHSFEFGPNLDIIPHVSVAYEQAAEEDKENRDHILRAHRNFLRDAVYFLYENNRVKAADYWFKYLGAHYPDKRLLDNKPESLPGKVDLDTYCVARIQEDINETSKDRVQAIIEGLIFTSLTSLAIGDDDRAAGYQMLAHKAWAGYQARIPQERKDPIGLSPYEDIEKDVLKRVLDPAGNIPPLARAVIRTKLGLPAETEGPKEKEAAPPTPAAGTNAPPAAANR